MKNTPTSNLVALCAAIVLSACGNPDQAELMASAKTYLAKGENKAAAIQLKAALQVDPGSGEARFLLGKALFDTGEFASANAELAKALELKQAPSRVLPVLAQSLLLAGQYKSLADSYGDIDLPETAAAASLKTSVAVAQGALHQFDKADAAANAALRAVPGYPGALVAQARVWAQQQRPDDALNLLDKAIASNPSDADAWNVKGEILFFGKGDAAQAMEAYRKAFGISPTHMTARSNAISLAMAQHDMKGAAVLLEELRARQPKHPQLAYFDAQIALARGDRDKARNLAQQLLKFAPDNDRILELAGAVEFDAGSLVQAEAFLSKAVSQSPGLATARQLLVRTYLRSGQVGNALAAVKPLISGPEASAEAHSLAGAVFLQTGDAAQAEIQFAKAEQLDPQNVKNRTALAVARMQTRTIDAAIEELHSISSTDSGTHADMALISTYLRLNDDAGALKAIDAVEAKQPGRPDAANLRGQLYMQRNDVVQARRNFERALALDANYMPAVSGLASLDLQENKPDMARQRFASMLAADPKNVEATLALAGLRARSGAPTEEVVGLLQKAVSLAPGDAAPRIALTNRHLTDKRFELALAVAQAGATALPENAEMQDALGRAQMAFGQTNQAINSFRKVAALQPRSADPQMRLAGAHLFLKDSEAAAQDLRHALTLTPDLLTAQQSLLDIEVSGKRFREAATIARTVQSQRPTDAAGFMMEGQVALAQKNVDAAATAYRTAHQKAPSATSAGKLYSVLAESAKPADADRLAASWTAEHPNDVDFALYVAEWALSTGNFNAAEARFRDVLKVQPDHFAALNNTAWILARTGKPGASRMAQRAVDLAPRNAGSLDTLAFALASENQVGRAVELQRQAVALAPDVGKLRLNLAKILVQTGNKAAARTELETLARLGNNFDEQAEVRAMFKLL